MPDATVHKSELIQLDYTSATAKSAGEIVQLPDGRAAVVQRDLAASELGVVYVGGVFEVTKATGTAYTEGDPLVWDASADEAVAGRGAVEDFLLGATHADAASGDTSMKIRLNAGAAGNASLSAAPVVATRGVTLAHDDTTEHTILSADDNRARNGMVVAAFFGVVTEQPVGDSEDQLILDLLDEDDNVLSQITTSDGTTDAVGDLVQGTRTLANGSTGDVAPDVGNGKALKVKVSQATAHSGTPAGEVRVQALVLPLL